mgnify:CR=1 FL=1
MKILIVEDEPSLREIMVQTLRREQYVVEQASDYASALEKIAGYYYDCILLDIMLPDGSGLEVLDFMRAQPRLAEVPQRSQSCAACSGRFSAVPIGMSPMLRMPIVPGSARHSSRGRRTPATISSTTLTCMAGL